MALRETTHQYIFFILSQSLLVYIGLIGLLPRLSSFLCRYVSFQFHLPYAFLVSAFIPLFTHLFIGFGPITGIISCSGELPIGASIGVLVCSQLVRLLLSALFGERFLCLVLLWLGLVSSESHRQVQLIRAELSSKCSSERHSESLSKLSSHQIPRCLDCL